MKYVIAKTASGGLGWSPDFDGYRKFGDLDPAIVMKEGEYAKAGNLSESYLWLAFRVRNADVQAVVDAATYTFAEESIPADDVTLDEHDIVVVDTKDECLSVLDEESFSQFIGVL